MPIWLHRCALGRRSPFVSLSATSVRSLVTARRISEILKQPSALDGCDISINGFVRTVRKQKRVAFAAISDGSSLEPLQAVLTPEQAANISTGTALSIKGKWSASLGAGQSYELRSEDVQILGQNDSENYPIQKKYHSPDFLRTLPHLRSRMPANSLLLRLRSETIAAFTQFFANREFIQAQPPLITSSDCEGAGEVFSVLTEDDLDYVSSPDAHTSDTPWFFKSKKYLTVSSQLHLEALAQSVGNVWALSPTFRAERSDTARHLSEFYMLEAEMAFCETLEDVFEVVESMLRHVTSQLVRSKVGDELLQLRDHKRTDESSDVERADLVTRWDGIMQTDWPRITFTEAIDRLQTAVQQKRTEFSIDPTSENGLQTEHERFIADEVGKGRPVFVTDYPEAIKPFYMAPSKSSNSTVACFDLLVPDFCEIIGGSLREHRLAELEASMQRKDVGADGLDWYLDLRRYGSVPHGGFGLGFDRLLCYLSGTSNIRDMVTFPRHFGRCNC